MTFSFLSAFVLPLKGLTGITRDQGDSGGWWYKVQW